jgi:hypothetical protein
VHATRWDPVASCWVHDDHDPELCYEHLQAGIQAFRSSVPEILLRHRFTRRILTDSMIVALVESGVKVDLTPEPSPLQSRSQRGIYQAGPKPCLTVIPASSTSQPPYGGPTWRRYARRIRRPRRRWHLSPYRMSLDPSEYWDLVAASLKAMRKPYVAIALRTYAAGSKKDQRHRALLEGLAHHGLARRLRFADPIELCAQIDGTTPESATN